MKKILLLGASGSVGRQTVDVIKEHPDELKLVGISVYENTEFLREMLQSFDLDHGLRPLIADTFGQIVHMWK